MIKNIDFEKYKKENNKLIQDFLISDKDKSRLGIVYTPIKLVEKIIENILIIIKNIVKNILKKRGNFIQEANQ